MTTYPDFPGWTAQVLTTFNTDNPYTTHGQRIVVWELVKETPEGSLCAFLMLDIDRQIDYRIEFGPFDTKSNYFRDYIWTCYQLPTKLVFDSEFYNFAQQVLRSEGQAYHYAFPSYRPHIVAFEYGEGRPRLSF